MKKIKLKRFFIMIASASAVAAINYTIFHTSFFEGKLSDDLSLFPTGEDGKKSE